MVNLIPGTAFLSFPEGEHTPYCIGIKIRIRGIPFAHFVKSYPLPPPSPLRMEGAKVPLYNVGRDLGSG